jgi:hypothetical protein
MASAHGQSSHRRRAARAYIIIWDEGFYDGDVSCCTPRHIIDLLVLGSQASAYGPFLDLSVALFLNFMLTKEWCGFGQGLETLIDTSVAYISTQGSRSEVAMHAADQHGYARMPLGGRRACC